MTEAEVQIRKRSTRRAMLSMRRRLEPTWKRDADRRINQQLMDYLRHDDPSVVVAYATDGTEPDLTRTMRQVLSDGRTLCLPRFRGDGEFEIVIADTLDLPESHWNIPEPGAGALRASPDLLSKALWLVPGVAFDAMCNRLGRGKGIYDRLLSGGVRKSIGIYYELQKCEKIPTEPQDRGTDLALTELRFYGLTINATLRS